MFDAKLVDDVGVAWWFARTNTVRSDWLGETNSCTYQLICFVTRPPVDTQLSNDQVGVNHSTSEDPSVIAVIRMKRFMQP